MDLVLQARSGSDEAWNGLVKRLSGVVWRTMYTMGIRQEAALDVSQIAWLRLLENLDQIREPEKLVGWLATTTRNESLAYLRRRARTEPRHLFDEDQPTAAAPLDEDVLDEELRRAVRQAFLELGPDCQGLLRLLTTEPPLSYAEIAAILEMKRGSVGPTRHRCLERLRQSPALAPFIEE